MQESTGNECSVTVCTRLSAHLIFTCCDRYSLMPKELQTTAVTSPGRQRPGFKAQLIWKWLGSDLTRFRLRRDSSALYLPGERPQRPSQTITHWVKIYSTSHKYHFIFVQTQTFRTWRTMSRSADSNQNTTRCYEALRPNWTAPKSHLLC